ncbi:MULTISPECIES: PLAT/LH2 domain-containing protein [unclassified Streptomyces]|uniref:PLAT/LH2 domain-containing protein n=1 Tax=unclassified Streptomyces TaxID=2593676 RepID=UPI000DD5F0A4|nr:MULTISPECIES: PLAT/LH2 domain-containing protein [unclassified Streptomyces]QZZ25529.1 hypothetical protein A7X85_03860 [Streptomyces sp. ST1015]
MHRRLRTPVLLACAALAVGASTAQAHPAQHRASAPTAYNVTIHVCDAYRAGTDDNVWGRLRDSKGTESSWVLFDKSGYDDFERNDNDTYKVSVPADFDTPSQIVLSKDGSNGLCVDKITVQGVDGGDKHTWYNTAIGTQWLDQVEDCGSSAGTTCLGNKHTYNL